MIRKHIASQDIALRHAQTAADDRGAPVQVWRLTKKDGSLRFDVLYLDEAPKGEGWTMVQEVEPEAND